MNQKPTTQDSITALMGAVTLGKSVTVDQSVTIDPDGHTHLRDENTPQARADFEANIRERMARTEAEPALEAYSDGATEGQRTLSQRAVNHIIDEAHLGCVETAVLVLGTADRIEAAWAKCGIELEVDLSALSQVIRVDASPPHVLEPFRLVEVACVRRRRAPLRTAYLADLAHDRVGLPQGGDDVRQMYRTAHALGDRLHRLDRVIATAFDHLVRRHAPGAALVTAERRPRSVCHAAEAHSQARDRAVHEFAARHVPAVRARDPLGLPIVRGGH